jgi:hypothetical protein
MFDVKLPNSRIEEEYVDENGDMQYIAYYATPESDAELSKNFKLMEEEFAAMFENSPVAKSTKTKNVKTGKLSLYDVFAIYEKGKELEQQIAFKRSGREILNDFLWSAKSMKWDSHPYDYWNDDYYSHLCDSTIDGLNNLLYENRRIINMLSKRLSRNKNKIKKLAENASF